MRGPADRPRFERESGAFGLRGATDDNEGNSVMFGRDKRQRRRRIAAVGAAGVAAKKHHDAKVAGEEEETTPQTTPATDSTVQSQAAAADGLSEDSLARLKELGELHDQNVLSDEEFEREKSKLLG
jgi:hypothetical protein